MLIHHGSQTYDAAASEAATEARAKMEAMIDRGRVSAGNVIDKVMREVPRDALVRGRAFGDAIRPAAGGLNFLDATGEITTVTRHALGQIASRADLPMAYVSNLLEKQEPWARDLLAHNVRELYSRDESRYLTRSVNGQLRGFLSDKFKRIDSRPVLESAIAAFQDAGLTPCDGYASETQVNLKAVLPVIFEPVPNEVMLFGLEWSNSDYGKGTNSLRAFVLRLMCTNKAVMDYALRQVHLGRRLENETLYSEKTIALDTAAAISAVGDIVRGALTPDTTKAYCEIVRRAHEDKINPAQTIERMKQLTKGERAAVSEAFNSADVEMLPAGNTTWRLSNALSWVAGHTDDTDRRIELEREAGKVLPALAA